MMYEHCHVTTKPVFYLHNKRNETAMHLGLFNRFELRQRNKANTFTSKYTEQKKKRHMHI